MDLFAVLADLSSSIPGGGLLYTVFVFVVVLGILIFVHEWGHYAAARSVGIFVEVFSIGFGPVLWQTTDRHGTKWQIAIIPLGGYAQMKGQTDGKPVETAEGAEDDSFAAKSVLARMWVVVAGPLANFALALGVLIALMGIAGDRQLMPTIGDVQVDMPAAAAGLQAGDVIKLVNDEEIASWNDVQNSIKAVTVGDVQVLIERDGQLMPFLITPVRIRFTDLLGDEHVIGRVGIVPSGERFTERFGVLGAIQAGALKTWEMTTLTVYSVYKLIIGAVSPKYISGPLGIADLASQSAEQGTYALILFLAIISVNLGILNLLPIPVLDGGHLVFLAYEAMRGKPAGEKAQIWSLRVGLFLLFSLILFATSNDVKRLFSSGTTIPELEIQEERVDDLDNTQSHPQDQSAVAP